jgi:hypothetical protein
MGGQDLSVKPLLDELRDATDVVDVGVGDKEEVNVRRLYRPILYTNRHIAPLARPAVHEDVQALHPEKVTRPRDTVLRTHVSQSHRKLIRHDLTFLNIRQDIAVLSRTILFLRALRGEKAIRWLPLPVFRPLRISQLPSR